MFLVPFSSSLGMLLLLFADGKNNKRFISFQHYVLGKPLI